MNFLRSKWLTHQLNAIDRDELPNEIKGKTSVINKRTHCHFPFQSGGTELAVAELDAPCTWGAVVLTAAAKVELVGSLGGHELVQAMSGLTGTTACDLSKNKGKSVGGEWGSPVHGQL